jgi:hypothetical protein
MHIIFPFISHIGRAEFSIHLFKDENLFKKKFDVIFKQFLVMISIPL